MSKNTISILDGGMSRELEKLGAPFRQPEWSALALIETPNLVRDAHQAFIDAGSQVITTNSYAVVPFHIGDQRFRQEGKQLAALSGKMAKEAVANTGNTAKIAGSLPPLFGSYRADLFEAELVTDIATPLIEGLAPYVDVWLNETQSLIAEPKAMHSLLKALGHDDKPLWVSFTLEDETVTDIPRLRSGESVEEAVIAMANDGVAAILFNCCQPEVIGEAIRIARETLHRLGQSDIQLGAYANAFAPQSKDAAANEELDEIRDDLTPPSYVNWTQQWVDEGATLLGGCCGIGVEHIAKLRQHFSA